MNISNVLVTLSNGETLKCKETVYLTEQETVQFLFEKDLTVGKAVLEMDYVGELNDKMKGFYRSKYFTEDGKERYAAVTQFEATDARRVDRYFL